MISFVQTDSFGSTTDDHASKSFPSPQTAGNFNIVVINFGKGAGSFVATVASITDTLGNTYSQATPIDRMVDGAGNGDGIAIYYSANIFSGSNTVTVTLSAISNFFAFTILEYSGLSNLSPIDVVTSNVSNGPSASTLATTGSITTTNDNALILGAFCLFDGPVSGDSGYTVRSSFYTILVEDIIVSTTGTYSASSTSANTLGWIGQIVAFKDALATVAQDYAILSDDRSSVLTVMSMDPEFKANMLSNNPDLILLPVNRIAKPPFLPGTQTVIQSGWTIGSVDVEPIWVVIDQTNDQMVVSAAQLYYNTVTPGLVETFTLALDNWGTQTPTTKDLLLFDLLNVVNATLQSKLGLQLPFRLSLSGSLGITGGLQLNKLFLSLLGGIGITGLVSLEMDLNLTGVITISGEIVDPLI